MIVFLDTNIFLEYFEQRRECQSVAKLFDAIEDGKVKGVVSVGCAYTLAYLIRMELKRQGIHRPEQTIKLRSTLNTILSMVTSVGITHKRLIQGVNDENFDDIEDSFQYQSALQSKCDALITINLRDFENVDASKIEIMSPTEFVNKYL
ncbi:MAG: PIN domain-containing protein [Bacteroidales bacterium]|nr:PIN domain-containing protein [Bacteroidales bacterium]